MTEITTPNLVSKVPAPKKLTAAQRSVVTKLVDARYNMLEQAVRNAPRPKDEVKLTPQLENYRHYEFDTVAALKEVPDDLAEAWKAARAASKHHDKIRQKYADKQAVIVNKFNDDQNAVLRKLQGERLATQAAVLLDTAQNEVHDYLAKLPGFEDMMPILASLGVALPEARKLLGNGG